MVGKKPKKVVNPDELLPLGENDRNIKVVFHGQLVGDFESSFRQLQNSSVIVQTKLDTEVERSTLLDAILNQIASSDVTPASKKDPNIGMKAVVSDSGHVSFLLAQKRMTITLPLLTRLCSGFSDEFVSFHLPAGGSDAASVMLSARGKKGGGAESSKGRDKRKSSLMSAPLGNSIDKVIFRFEDVMRCNSKRYDIHLGDNASCLTDCWVELVCLDLPLLPEAFMQKYRPVSVVVHSVELAQDLLSDDDSDEEDQRFSLLADHSPPRDHNREKEKTTTTAGDGAGGSSMSPAVGALSSGGSGGAGGLSTSPPRSVTDKKTKIYAVIDCVGAVITTPPLPVRRTASSSSSSGAEGIRRDELEAATGGSVATPSAASRRGDSSSANATANTSTTAVAAAGSASSAAAAATTAAVGADAADSSKKEVFRTVFFLGHSTPLRVLQRILFDRVSIAVHREAEESLLSDAESVSKFHFGTGTFSVRSLVESNQTFFHEAVQLLPNRMSLVTSESTLTSACTVSLSLDFFIPLSPVEHVNEAGEPKEGNFMTRGVMVMPYAPNWAEAAIGAMLRELLKSKRVGPADGDVRAFAPAPPVEPEEVEEPVVGKKGKGKNAAGHGHAAAGEAQQQHRSSSKESSKKEHSGSKGASKGKGGRGKGKAPPPSPPPPPKKTAFEEPFKVISPEGISGFEVIDGEIRLICLEGPLQEVHRILRSTAEGCHYPPELKILYNSELFIPSRQYVRFPPLVTPPDLTKLALRRGNGKDADEHHPGVVMRDDEMGDADTASKEAEGAGVEAEAGGTGGRVHRIRLRDPLSALVKQQRYLLHRTLSESCLSCFQKLHALSLSESIWEASQRSFFPSAADLISLERSFGQTLDLQDIFARANYVNMSEILTEDPTAAMRKCQPVVSRMHEVDVKHLTEDDVGLLTSFQGLLLSKPRHVPADVLRRYATCLWMVTKTGEPVLCAFPREVPGGTIQYVLEGQVVRVGRTLLLYIMEFHTISNSITSSKNPAYEEFLRRRRWCVKQMALLAGDQRANRRKMSGRGATSQEQQQQPFLSSSTTRWQGRQRHGRGGDALPDSDSDDDDDLDGAADLPPDDKCSSVGSTEAEFAVYWENRFAQPRGTRSSTFLEYVNRQEKPTPSQYAMLWDMYDQRAPKKGPEYPAGPVMHFGRT